MMICASCANGYCDVRGSWNRPRGIMSGIDLMSVYDEAALLLELPVPLAALVTIKLPVTSAARIQAKPTSSGLLQIDQHTMHMHKIWQALNQMQPGGPLVAFPCSASQCQIICHKVITIL